jgi:hypothetical protein
MKRLTYYMSLLSLLPVTAFSQNLISSSSWNIAAGNVGIFEANGSASENIREMGTDPYGTQNILWKAVPDGGNNDDGGWNTTHFSIDNSKMYRFSIWIKKTNSTDGTTYFGVGSAQGILALSGSVNSNPYFWYGDLPALNKWYLLVGYVHASNDPSTTSYGGIYDGETGARVLGMEDFKFSTSATTAYHRTYLYYDVNTSDRQYFFNPEVYQMADNKPVGENVTSVVFNGNALFNKKVGIGTATPSGNLHIHAATPEIFITTNDWAALRGNGGMWLFGYNGTAGNEDISIGTQSGSGSRTLTLAAGGAARLKILANGNVGIGTANPNKALTVNGTIYGKEVQVDLSVPGPDYVFEKDYHLPSLEEIENYIDQNKHLPEVPSAKEMEANGISVGEMNMILLKKVEELTLYLIEMRKENERQNQLIKQILKK